MAPSTSPLTPPPSNSNSPICPTPAAHDAVIDLNTDLEKQDYSKQGQVYTDGGLAGYSPEGDDSK